MNSKYAVTGSIVLMLLAVSVSAQTPTVGKWERYVISLPNSSYSGNPFELNVEGVFTHPQSGTTLTLPGYYDGNDTWEIGFMPIHTGSWNYVTVSSDPDLNNQTGTIDVIESGRPGMLKPDTANPKKWKYTDGPYVVPMGLFASAMLDDATTSQFTAMADFIKQNNLQSINFRISEHNLAFASPSNPQNHQMNLTLWNRLEERMAILAQRGLGIDIMLYTDDSGKPTFPAYSAEEQLLIRYTVSRLAGYPVVMFNTGIDLAEYRDKAWTDWYGNLVRSLDPYQHPVSSRVFGTVVMDPAIRTFHSVGNRNSKMVDLINAFSSSSNGNMPALNNDNWSEDYNGQMVGNINRHLPEDIRRAAWKATIAGGVGFHVRHNVSNCFNGLLRECDRYFNIASISTQLHSEQWLSKVNSFIQTKLSNTFATMVPDTSVVSGTGIHALADPARTKILYFLIGKNDLWNTGSTYGGPVTIAISSLPASVTYAGIWFDPRTGVESSAGTFNGGSDYIQTPPSQEDWVLLLTAATPVCLGDVTQDQTRDISDPVRCIRYLLGLETLTGNELIAADANQDGSVDLLDVIRIIRDLLGLEPLPACQ